MKVDWRTEPFRVTNLWDDLWLGVICLSNQEIAGSPRNIFRYSFRSMLLRGRALNGSGIARYRSQSNSEYSVVLTECQRYTAKRVSRKGNSPDFHLRSLN